MREFIIKKLLLIAIALSSSLAFSSNKSSYEDTHEDTHDSLYQEIERFTFDHLPEGVLGHIYNFIPNQHLRDVSTRLRVAADQEDRSRIHGLSRSVIMQEFLTELGRPNLELDKAQQSDFQKRSSFSLVQTLALKSPF